MDSGGGCHREGEVWEGGGEMEREWRECSMYLALLSIHSGFSCRRRMMKACGASGWWKMAVGLRERPDA